MLVSVQLHHIKCKSDLGAPSTFLMPDNASIYPVYSVYSVYHLARVVAYGSDAVTQL
jgi:hypothetical protein